jgi:hypothetical protein
MDILSKVAGFRQNHGDSLFHSGKNMSSIYYFDNMGYRFSGENPAFRQRRSGLCSNACLQNTFVNMRHLRAPFRIVILASALKPYMLFLPAQKAAGRSSPCGR